MTDTLTTAAAFVQMLELEIQLRLDGTWLTLRRYSVLTQADGRSAADLARMSGVSQQSVSTIVRDLYHLGYLEKVPDEDRRSHRLRVTDLGRDVLERARRLHLPAPLVAAMEAYVAGGAA